MVTVELKKFHVKGLLEGLTTTETMRFVDWESAQQWCGAVTMKPTVKFVVLRATNLDTGESQRF